jgi:hypothetical protein
MNTFSTIKFLMLIATIGLFTFSSCSESCDNEDPRARIVNNGTAKASVQIKTSGGNTENINNIESGQISDWRSFAAGNTEFTLAIQGEDDTLVVVHMLNCYEYSINIDGQNNVSSSAAERE